MGSREESAILNLVKRYATRIFSLAELTREAALPEAATKDAAECLVAQGLLARTLRGNYFLPPDPDGQDLRAAPEIVCPFCHFRRPFAPADSRSPFSPLAQIEVYHCPCGAVASPSADAVYGRGCDLQEVERVLGASVLGAEPNDCRVDLTHIARTVPPILLLWVKQVRRDSGRTE
jgi:hypothetical protein